MQNRLFETGTDAQGLRALAPVNPLLRYVDAITVPVPDLDQGMAFYRDVTRPPADLAQRRDRAGRAPPGRIGHTEIVLTTRQAYEPDWKVHSADAAAQMFAAHGGKVLAGPVDIPIGRLAVVEDPFGNRLVLLDSTKGTYDTDKSGAVTGISLVALTQGKDRSQRPSAHVLSTGNGP